jgi:hypothetical protein
MASERGGIYDHQVNSGVQKQVFVPFFNQKQELANQFYKNK